MIDGMTIVSAGTTHSDMAVGLTILGAMMCVLFVFIGAVSLDEGYRNGVVVSVIFIILSTLAFVKGVLMPEITTVRAIVRPDADITEIVRRYEVQSIDGQIWELVEKEQMK